MRYNIVVIILVSVLFPYFVSAQSTAVCSSKGYTVLTVNGIFTDKEEAGDNKRALQDKILESYPAFVFNKEKLTVDFLYNETHLAGLGDAIDAVQQGLFDQKSDYDLTEMLDDASEKVKTQKLLLVAHSQGNFYSNNFYDKVAGIEGGVPKESIGMYGVASPANRVAGEGRYLTSDTDSVIAGVVGRFIKILKPNIHIPLVKEDGNGHSFSDVYLKYQGDRIVSDIKSSLSKLKENDGKEGPCISPPELSLSHKIKKVVFAVADPTASVVRDGLAGKYDVGAYIVKGIYKSGLAVNNIFKNLSANVIESVGDPEVATTILPQVSETKEESVEENLPQETENQNSPTPLETTSSGEGDTVPENINVVTDVIVEENILQPSAPKKTTTRRSGFSADGKNNEDDANTEILESEPETVIDESTEEEPPVEDVTPVEETKEEPEPAVTPVLDTVGPVITLLGADLIDVTKGTVYTDAGATALDDVDGEREVSVTGTVDTATLGEYILTYSASDLTGNVSTLTRTVNVVADTTPPVITLIGESYKLIKINSSYSDQGATALDDVDGDVAVTVTGSVNTAVAGTYTVTYSAVDSAGNSGVMTRTVKVASRIYVPKYSFGKNNGDGNNWQVWLFNGSYVYDWTDTYVDNYLREQFKIKANKGPAWCSQCLERGIWKHDPQKGFESGDVVSLTGLENNPQNRSNDITYDVIIQWDSTGYTYTISHDDIVDFSGHTNVPNMNKGLWVGWDGSFNKFQKFPSGNWNGVVSNSLLGRTGGSDMILKPYPVYQESVSDISYLSFPNKDSHVGTGISPTRGRTNLTPFTFKIIYTDKNNNAPERVNLFVTNSETDEEISTVEMFQVEAGEDGFSDGDFTNGEAYISDEILYDTGNYNYYFSAILGSGDEIRIPETGGMDFGVVPSTYTYIPKYSFGKDNGDGNDWQVWTFNGSFVYDWTNTYVDNYLLEQFKIKPDTNPNFWCSQCLQRGIFNHDPQKGFEAEDVIISGLENNPQNKANGIVYMVSMQWDSSGYTYTISHDGIVDFTGHTDIVNVNENMWVGWDGSFNKFQKFPSGNWQGMVVRPSLNLTGGSDMVLRPYPVYLGNE